MIVFIRTEEEEEEEEKKKKKKKKKKRRRKKKRGCNMRHYRHNQKSYGSEESHAEPARPSCEGHAGGWVGHWKVKKIR